MKIGFVILNYNTFDVTKDCILSIENKIDTSEYVIVVVDNASKDNSNEQIAQFIKKREKVILLCNDKNLGFAKGNNVGIKYINDYFKPDYVVVLNSDTELIQDDLVAKLEKEYKKSEFALLGPLILTANGRCDNSPHCKPTIDNVNKELKNFKKQERIIKLGLYKCYCGISFLKEVISNKIFNRKTENHRNLEFQLYQQQVVLQGCFLVFSKKAFNYINGFDDRTFLYYEEPILFLNLMKYNLVTVYNPEIVIYHKDGISTGKIAKKNKKRLLFIYKCYQESAKILLDVLMEVNNGN